MPPRENMLGQTSPPQRRTWMPECDQRLATMETLIQPESVGMAEKRSSLV
jgi:hypothetical protein